MATRQFPLATVMRRSGTLQRSRNKHPSLVLFQILCHSAVLGCLTVAQAALSSASDVATVPTVESLSHISPALPKIPDRTFNVKDFGAVGDGKTWDTEAIRKAIAEVNKAGGGRLVVPAGVYLTLPIELCSQLDLHLEDGAVLQAAGTFTDFGLPEPETLKDQNEVKEKVKMPAPFVSGNNLHDVAISGTGAIDGAGATWWAWSERASRAQPGRLVYPRPKMVVIDGCQRLHISGVTLRNSPMFHLVPRKVSDLLIEDVKIKSPLNAPNTDAMDPSDCNNVLIRKCDIDVGDDDVVIKAGGHDILVEDCNIHHGHGLSIGSETANGVHDVLFRHCTMDNTDNGIRIKSMRGAGGLVQRIHYDDIQMKNVRDAIVLDLQYVDNNRPDFRGDPDKIPKIQDIDLRNVTVESAHNAGKIRGLPERPISRVTFQNVSVNAEKDFVVSETEQVDLDQITRTIKKAQ
ncbi:MAG TPA: glycoside hydrolase family 28 protein [Pirellulales bacterium]|jgi:polygalacturonase